MAEGNLLYSYPPGNYLKKGYYNSSLKKGYYNSSLKKGYYNSRGAGEGGGHVTPQNIGNLPIETIGLQ